MAVLIDTSFLLATLYSKDTHHIEARRARQSLKDQQVILIPVLQELFHLIATRSSYGQAIQAFETFHSAAFSIERLTDEDMSRMAEIMRQYSDAELDFADTAIMAVSERLNITQVYTFDRRDFGMFRPKHADFLTLKP
jgi:predicted nucleic acid-binding protein